PVIDISTDASNSAANRPRTQFVVRKQFFNWSQVESPDYPVYIARLREIGCPEETIRDIVIADVNKLYANKRLDEVPTQDQEWWRSTPDTNLIAAAAAKTQALEQERRALLNTLLGPNWQVEDAERKELALNGPVLGDLSPETKQAVRDIVARYQKDKQAYLDARRANGQAADPADVARAEQAMRADLSKILTPAQLEEFLLRYSSTAADLRNQLRDFNVTADEFRAIFRLRDPIAQQIALASGPNTSPTELAAEQKEMQDAIKNVLGPDRFQSLQLSQDPAYRDAVSVAAQYGAPSNVVQALYRLNLAAKAEQDRINNDPTLSPDQKAAQLQALADQEQATGDQLLGLTQPDAPAPPLPPPPMQIHAYSPGETIDQIAAQYGVSAASIINANPDLNLNTLSPRTPIRIPQKQ
ncbi:MAG TPA: LysM domain-containing protein, partial [Verrucomicrobiae bacterium]|nr:LysM domain-containing protein [Verrucomicrobiae bacterium]